VGEIRVGEEANPTITVQLSGVDTATIIEQARQTVDNQGNRIRRVRQMLFETIGIQGEGEFEQYHDFWWRNTKRSCKVLFKNVRELPNSSLENEEADWKLIIDFPFDETGHGPRDDLSVIQRFMQAHPEGTKTLCWVPSFFSQEALSDLGVLVALEHILTGERFGQFTNHLSPQDRQAAKSILESQRNQLRQRVQNHLDAAYGLDAITQGSLDTTHDLDPNEHYVSLCPGFVPRPSPAANLDGAMQHLLSQALEHEFPAAPHFEAEVKSSSLKKVYEQVFPATQVADGRLPIDKTMRPIVRHIAAPLLLGEMGIDATHFVLGQHWKTHIGRKAAETGSAMSVGQLRRWMDDPKPMGLPKDAQNAVILMFAAQTSQTLYLHGAPYEATLTNVPDACELRPVDLPPPLDWELALKRAGSIFGVAGLRLLSAGNVNTLSADCKKKAGEARKACQTYCQCLKQRMTELGMTPDATDRMKTAAATQAMVDQLSNGEQSAIVTLLAKATVATSETAMGECVSKAAELEGNLDTAGWQTFELIEKLRDEHQATAQAILKDLKESLAKDEHVLELAPVLKSAQAQAMRLLEKAVEKKPVTQQPGTPPPDTPPPITPPPGWELVDEGIAEGLDVSKAKDELAVLEKKLREDRRIHVQIRWRVEEKKD
jgi:hypothetical protein